MAKNNPASHTPPEAVISIIGAGMTIEGDSETDGSLRVEGTIRGNVRAGKSVVVGKDGLVDGSVFTQDAVIAGRVSGGIHAESRLELQATSEVSGEIVAPRMQVEEGAKVQGQVAVGESAVKAASKATKRPEIGGGAKAAGPQTKPKVGGRGEAERRTDSKQPGGGGNAERQTPPEPGRGGRAERQTEPEALKEKRQTESKEVEKGLQQPSRD